MKALRIVLLVVAVAGAGLGVLWMTRPEDGNATPKEPETGTPEPWSPTGGSPAPAPAAAPQAPSLPIEATLEEPAPRGAPVPEGEAVPIDLRRVPGTVSKYVVEDRLGIQDRASGAEQFFRQFLYLTTEVLSVEPDGSARVRVRLDARRDQAQLAVGYVWDYDSRNPPPEPPTDVVPRLMIEPPQALVGLSAEFRLGPDGRALEVEGAEAWSDAYLTAAEKVDAAAARQAPEVPDAQWLLERFRLYLFPPIGGGTLEGGATREVRFSEALLERWGVVFPARLAVTHSGEGSFRIAGAATPGLEERGGTARSPMFQNIAQVRVVSSADAWKGAWLFDRDPGRLRHARIGMEYQVWAADRVAPDLRTGTVTPSTRFTIMKREILVDLVE